MTWSLLSAASWASAAASPRDRVASIWFTAKGLTASVVATSPWSVSASAIGLKPLAVTGTTTPTRRGPGVADRRRLLIRQERGEAGERGGCARPHECDRHGVDPGAHVGGQRATQRQGGGGLAGRADAGPRGRGTGVRVGQDGHAGRGGETAGSCRDGQAGHTLERCGARRAGHRLLQVGAVGDAPVEGEVDAEAAGRTLSGGDAEGDVEPGLVGCDPRRLGRQNEGCGTGAGLLHATSSGRSQGADQGRNCHRERAEGGAGPARRHRERLEGALAWAGAVHVGSRAVPPLCRRDRGGGAAFRRRREEPGPGGRLGSRRPLPGPLGDGRAARPRPHDRCPSGRDRATGAGLGRRHLDAGRALRDHRLPQGHPGLRDHDLPGRGLRARFAQARGHVRHGPRPGPVAPGLHHQRAGASPARTWSWSTRSTAWGTWRPVACARRWTRRSPSATTPSACCARPASRPASRSSPTRP